MRALLSRLSTWVAISVALLVGILTMGIAGGEVAAIDGWPREQARLLSAPESEPSPRGRSCGRGGGWSRDLTWESAEPPAGLPATFEQSAACIPTVDPGDLATIVRVIDDDGDVTVHVDPIESRRDAVLLGALLGLVLGFVPIVAVAGARRWWLRRRAATSAT